MGRIDSVHLVVVLCLGMLVGLVCCQDNVSAVYIVTLKQAPGAVSNAEFLLKTKPFKQDGKVNRLDKPLARYNFIYLLFLLDENLYHFFFFW